MATAADELARVPLFAELSGRQRRKLAASFRERLFRPGTDVVRQGAMSGIGFFVVTGGEAAVSVDGAEVATLAAGDHFGELALVNQAERTATVTARTELRCLEIPFSGVPEVRAGEPGRHLEAAAARRGDASARARSADDGCPAAAAAAPGQASSGAGSRSAARSVPAETGSATATGRGCLAIVSAP